MTNTTTIVGRFTRAPEIRYSQQGKALASFGVAVERRRKNAAGEWESDTEFFDGKAFGDLAERVAELEQGTRVIVVGRLSARTWETKAGDKRTAFEVIADDVGASVRFASVSVTRNERRGQAQQGEDFGEEPFA